MVADSIAAPLQEWLDTGLPLLRLPAATPVAGVLDSLCARGLEPCTVDLRPIPDKAALLAALHQALELGPWFGFNWDALEEALHGPEDRAAPERVLVCVGFQAFHDRAATAAEGFLDIVATVAANPDSTLRGCILLG